MLFNSIEFSIFLPIVFILFWVSGKYSLKAQNTIVLGASLLFYGWWDWRFLFLLLFSSAVDFFIGIGLESTQKKRLRFQLLILSLLINLGLLGFFKYYNFFLDSFVDSFQFFGTQLNINRLNIILPVGISFYTFQTLSYSIDVYRKTLQPTRDPIAFFAFVSFFPQLVAGPIERASNLLPQFSVKKTFQYDKAVVGLRQILWGLFKKMVIADNCALIVETYYNTPEMYSGYALLLASVLFAIQIYCDFSGYSDIAIGTAKLFGFDLMRNFAFPYFSRNVAEFWRRWHISLSTWFRDYLYFPLGGSVGSIGKQIRNIFIIFLVSGFWHGANWTFIFWGGLNALYFLPSFLRGKNKKYNWTEKPLSNGTFYSKFLEFKGIVFTFFLAVIAWVFFRSLTLHDAFTIIKKIFIGFFDGLGMSNLNNVLVVMLLTTLMISIEWFGRGYQFALEKMNWSSRKWMRWMAYSVIIILIGVFSPTEETPFIYFQF